MIPVWRNAAWWEEYTIRQNVAKQDHIASLLLYTKKEARPRAGDRVWDENIWQNREGAALQQAQRWILEGHKRRMNKEEVRDRCVHREWRLSQPPACRRHTHTEGLLKHYHWNQPQAVTVCQTKGKGQMPQSAAVRSQHQPHKAKGQHKPLEEAFSWRNEWHTKCHVSGHQRQREGLREV